MGSLFLKAQKPLRNSFASQDSVHNPVYLSIYRDVLSQSGIYEAFKHTPRYSYLYISSFLQSVIHLFFSGIIE